MFCLRCGTEIDEPKAAHDCPGSQRPDRSFDPDRWAGAEEGVRWGLLGIVVGSVIDVAHRVGGRLRDRAGPRRP